jgi:double-stranded uracil-DNA glycosylase
MRVGLPPVVAAGARVLILGSFPSERSLETGEYYANRRNQFWPLLGNLFGFAADLPYAERLVAVTDHGIALWDVIGRCRRAGSMDHKIDRRTLAPNDFRALLGEHPGIERVYLNGLTAFDLYERHAALGLPALRLPSSSGAAAMPLADKLEQWRIVIRP